MAIIKIPDHRSAELTDLETHVMLCEQRRMSMDRRMTRLEDQIDEFEEQVQTTRRIIITSLLSIAAGILTTIIATLLK
jgi:hypothetical protein